MDTTEHLFNQDVEKSNNDKNTQVRQPNNNATECS